MADEEFKNVVLSRMQNTDIIESHPRKNELLQAERITQGNLQKMLDNANALIEFQNRATTLILKRTKNEDWFLIDGKPYPLESAVKKALQTIGADITNIRIAEELVIETNEGKDFPVKYFTVYGDMSFNGRIVQAIGTSSTKDKFFAERKKKIKDLSGKEENVKYLLPLDEVDVSSVKKKAVTNLYYRGLSLIMKLNPTLEELKAIGITPTSGYSHGKGTSGGSTDSAAEKDERTKLNSLLAKAAQELGKSAVDVLKEATAFDNFPGYTTVDRVSVAMVPKAIKNIESMLKALEQKGGEQK